MAKNYKRFTDEWNAYYGFGDWLENQPLPTSKTARIELHPHYTNPKFAGKGEVEIWGRKQDGIGYDYSDRFWQWDYKKAEAAHKVANATTPTSTAAWVEVFISEFYGKPVEVCHIYSGVNASSGYPYWAAGYKERT